MVQKSGSMTRCRLLEEWFDEWSKKLDEEEARTQQDLITGDKK